jgi:hypothetical protein
MSAFIREEHIILISDYNMPDLDSLQELSLEKKQKYHSEIDIGRISSPSIKGKKMYTVPELKNIAKALFGQSLNMKRKEIVNWLLNPEKLAAIKEHNLLILEKGKYSKIKGNNI